MPYKDPSVRKSKHKEYSREHYLANQKETKQRTKKNKSLLKKEWFIFKGTLKCSKCGFNHIAALDFHHTNPALKDGNINRFVSNGQFAKVYEEIKKCIVLCANCHRIHHHEEKKKQSPAF
jgi:hypothetical protein